MFNEGMPAISGKWLNKRTGKQIIVRDSIIDGDNMMIMSDIGQISMEEFSRDYIQVSDDIYDSSGKTIGKANDNGIIEVPKNEPQKIQKHQDISEIIDIDPDSIPKKREKKEIKKGIANKNQQFIENSKQTNEQTKDIDLISKVFTKIHSNPKISIDIDWEEFPRQEISTLVKFLDIDKKDIAKYIKDRYLSDDELISLIGKFLIQI